MTSAIDLLPLSSQKGSFEKPVDVPTKKWLSRKLGALVGRIIGIDSAVVSSQIRSAEDQSVATRQQVASERTYSMDINPSRYDEQLDARETSDRMERDHVVKNAPFLKDQLNDSRENEIIYLAMRPEDATSRPAPRRKITEGEGLSELDDYLELATELADSKLAAVIGSSKSIELAQEVRSLKDNLTFIGEKEYQEAAAGIALYWKALLDQNPKQQILALAGVDKSLYQDGDIELSAKSDDYLLDNILAYFSEEEAEIYRERLITQSSEISAQDARDLRVILLDDWTISGMQLQNAAVDFSKDYPQFGSSVEIQLVVANDERIKYGLSKTEFGSQDYGDLPVPVRAYFRAHKASFVSIHKSETHITGAHSSVDYDFRDTIRDISTLVRAYPELLGAEKSNKLAYIPALAGVVRSYHAKDTKLMQRSRFEQKTRA